MSAVYEWQEAPKGDFAVIGDPVSHSLSPKMHAAAYKAIGLDYKYRAIHIAAGEVGAALDRLAELGYQGVNVTVPHKEEVLAWATKVDPFAAKVRAANTLRMSDRAAINTDAPGFLETLKPLRIERPKVLLLGAGGSARALSQALVDAGWSVQIFNRTHERAVTLARESGADAVEVPDPTGVGLILNTTAASLRGEAIELDWSRAPADAVAYDLMYAKDSTPFLNSAKAHHLRTADGLPLLAAQGALSFEWWLGIPAPRAAMLEALR